MSKSTMPIFLLLIITVSSLVVFYLWPEEDPSTPLESKPKIISAPKQTKPIFSSDLIQQNSVESPSQAPAPKPAAPESATEKILLDAPFTPQAPFGDWTDPVFHDGCEEAAVLMAMRWVRGERLTLEEAQEQIRAIAQYEENALGEFIDTSAQDTVKTIIKGYFNHQNASVKPLGSADEIIRELKKGNVVIVPANGRALKNPYYTPPGPERHMLLIRGYDYATEEFITNDAGTKRGEAYRYSKDVVYDSVRDYLTGQSLPITSINKVMISVGLNQ